MPVVVFPAVVKHFSYWYYVRSWAASNRLIKSEIFALEFAKGYRISWSLLLLLLAINVRNSVLVFLISIGGCYI
jgi:hypothetical protein